MAAEEKYLLQTVATIPKQYSEEVTQILVEQADASVKRLVKLTRATAPVGRRLTKRKFDQGRPHLFESISAMRTKTFTGRTAFVWYVRAPNSRIAHLVEKGYWRRDTETGFSGVHFLRDAVEVERPRYAMELKRALNDPRIFSRMTRVTNRVKLDGK